jgi:hypothetical protein
VSYAEIDISVSFFVSPRYLFDIIVYVVYNFNGASVNPVMKEVCQLTGSERYSYMRNWFAEHCLRGMHAPDFLLSGSQKTFPPIHQWLWWVLQRIGSVFVNGH